MANFVLKFPTFRYRGNSGCLMCISTPPLRGYRYRPTCDINYSFEFFLNSQYGVLNDFAVSFLMKHGI